MEAKSGFCVVERGVIECLGVWRDGRGRGRGRGKKETRRSQKGGPGRGERK